MTFYRDTHLIINLDAFANNYHYFENKTKKNIFTVVKANAYGLGATSIAYEAISLGTDYLCVATLDEALKLRKDGISHPILVMGYVYVKDAEIAKKNDITLTIPSLPWAQALAKDNVSGLKLHLKVNTSMNRLGVNTITEAQTALDLLEKHQIEGIYTHYYAQNPTEIERDFIKFQNYLNKLKYPFTWVHAASSYAALNFPESVTNAVRVGIGLYGGMGDNNLEFIAEFKTKVVEIRKITDHLSVSYNGVLPLQKNDRIAVLPVGYADGYLRANFNNKVSIKDKEYSIAGAICMDQTMVLVDDRIAINDKVTLLGGKISPIIAAENCQTIPYELLTSISPRVVRLYYKNNELVQIVNYLESR